MAVYNKHTQGNGRPFEPAWFLMQLSNSLRDTSLARKWITLNNFLLNFIKKNRTEADCHDYAVLNRLSNRPDGRYADLTDVSDALRKLIAFNQLFWTLKNAGTSLTDRDVANYMGNMNVSSLDEETYMLAMREVAKFVAWYFRKSVPPEIMKATQPLVDARKQNEPIIDLDEDDMAENQAQRSPIVLIVDNSTPMSAEIGAMSEGIGNIFSLIRNNKGLERGAEICVVTTATMGKAQLLIDFTTAAAAEQKLAADPAILAGKGPAHLDDAIDIALEATRRFSEKMHSQGQSHHTPWVGIFTCGKWLRSATVNTRLDECIERLTAMNRVEVHDITLHTVVVNHNALRDERQRANLESLPGELHRGTDLRTVFNELFMSVKRVREFSANEGTDPEADLSQRPAVEGVQLKNSGAL